MRAGRLKSITYHDAVMTIAWAITPIVKEAESRYGNVSQESMKAIVSIAYNTPMRKDILRNKNLVAHVKSGNRGKVEQFYENLTRGVEKHAGQSLNGLRTRRAKELDLMFS